MESSDTLTYPDGGDVPICWELGSCAMVDLAEIDIPEDGVVIAKLALELCKPERKFCAVARLSESEQSSWAGLSRDAARML